MTVSRRQPDCTRKYAAAACLMSFRYTLQRPHPHGQVCTQKPHLMGPMPDVILSIVIVLSLSHLVEKAMSSGRWYASMQCVSRPAPGGGTSKGYPAGTDACFGVGFWASHLQEPGSDV